MSPELIKQIRSIYPYHLSDLPDLPEKSEYMKIINSYPKPTQEFDMYGLKFTLEHLNYMGRNVLLLPVDHMAQYVDMITKTAIDENDEDFIYASILSPESNIENIDYNNVTATTYGNLAYIYLNCKDQSAKDICKSVLTIGFDVYLKELISYEAKCQQLN